MSETRRHSRRGLETSRSSACLYRVMWGDGCAAAATHGDFCAAHVNGKRRKVLPCSSPAKNASTRPEPVLGQAGDPKVNWMQCNKCSKWRKLPSDLADLPAEPWDCSKNSVNCTTSGELAQENVETKQSTASNEQSARMNLLILAAASTPQVPLLPPLRRVVKISTLPESCGDILSTYSSTKQAAESVGIELSQLSRSLICRPYNKRSPSGFLLCFEDQLGNLGFPINVPVVSSLPSLPSHLALIPRVDLVKDHSPVVLPEAVDEFVILSHRVIGNDVEFLVRYRNSQMWVDMHDVLRQARRSFNNYMAKSFW